MTQYSNTSIILLNAASENAAITKTKYLDEYTF